MNWVFLKEEKPGLILKKKNIRFALFKMVHILNVI